MVKVYISDITKLKEYFENDMQDKLEPFLSCLDSRRKEKISHYKKAGDKALCLGASLLLLYALQMQLSKQPREQQMIFPHLVDSDDGKPRLAENQQGYQLCDLKMPYFNLSHSGVYAVCAVSDKEVGVDIQQIRKVNDSTYHRIVTENQTVLTENQAELKMQTFARTFCVKESYAKLMGSGIKDILSGMTVVWENQMVYCNHQTEKGFFTEVFDIGEYACCICTYERDEVTKEVVTF